MKQKSSAPLTTNSFKVAAVVVTGVAAIITLYVVKKKFYKTTSLSSKMPDILGPDDSKAASVTPALKVQLPVKISVPDSVKLAKPDSTPASASEDLSPLQGPLPPLALTPFVRISTEPDNSSSSSISTSVSPKPDSTPSSASEESRPLQGPSQLLAVTPSARTPTETDVSSSSSSSSSSISSSTPSLPPTLSSSSPRIEPPILPTMEAPKSETPRIMIASSTSAIQHNNFNNFFISPDLGLLIQPLLVRISALEALTKSQEGEIKKLKKDREIIEKLFAEVVKANISIGDLVCLIPPVVKAGSDGGGGVEALNEREMDENMVNNKIIVMKEMRSVATKLGFLETEQQLTQALGVCEARINHHEEVDAALGGEQAESD